MEFLNKDIFDYKDYQKVLINKDKILLFDYDGTLAPFVKDREKAFMYEGFADLINKLAKKYKIYFITGRTVDSLKKLLYCLDFPPCIWGSHGNEVLKSNGDYLNLNPQNKVLLQKIWDYLELDKIVEHTEKKVSSIALHYREIPQNIRENIERLKKQILNKFNNIKILEFDGGYEFIIPSFNKGYAVSQIIKENKNCFPVYFGDDITDEDAFLEVKGSGISFLIKDTFRNTYADIWINSHQEFYRVLKNEFLEEKCLKED
ncbi:MAG: trehalose-phosphatase [Candidatus Muirbacterium halophilum]|nr:trehalose-phosphatase [Candidatus Muirbacterium halophilum]MCK9474371.1 trehalose-phosphatase [Candidatus Muirbacterium halophilum]